MAERDDHVHLRTCPLCEAMCGLAITVRGDRVVGIRPDEHDVWSRGYICPKGAVLGDLHHDPDRLRTPLVRDGSSWREVSWAEAFAEVERRLRPVIERDGQRGGRRLHRQSDRAQLLPRPLRAGAFIGLSGLRELYSAGTVDQWPKNLVCALMYGGMWTIPVPDLDRTDYLLMLGANPAASQGSLLAAADVLGRLDAIRGRGGTVVLIDPRRTATADHADEWLPVRPGTDAALLLGHGAGAVRRRPGRSRAARRDRRWCRVGACALSRLHAGSGDRVLRRSGRHHPAPGACARRGAARRGLRPHRHLHAGVRHARVVAGRGAEHAHRQPRPARAARCSPTRSPGR